MADRLVIAGAVLVELDELAGAFMDLYRARQTAVDPAQLQRLEERLHLRAIAPLQRVEEPLGHDAPVIAGESAGAAVAVIFSGGKHQPREGPLSLLAGVGRRVGPCVG